jgi:integrase
MALDKHPTKIPGVRYRQNKARKFMGKPDKYFFIRYRANGKLKEEGIGWASEGWNPKKASLVLSELKKNHLTAEGPQTLAEKRAIENERKELERVKKERLAKETLAFSDYFQKRYFPESKINKNWRSYAREDSLFRLWIEPVIGRMPFKDIRPFHLERIKKNMTDAGKAPRSIQYALAVVRQVFNHSIKNEIYSGDNPARKVTKPKIDNRRIRFLTHEEADLVLDNLMARSQQLHDIALLSLHCGLRAGEIFNLTWGCVDFKNGSIVLMNTKSGKNRTVYMTEEVKGMLSGRIIGKPNDLVFKGRKASVIKEISNAFNRAVIELGLNDGITDPRHRVYFHTLRHTFASWLVQNGTNLYTVKELMGHSTLAMTERYAHLGQDNLRSAVKKLEESLIPKSARILKCSPENRQLPVRD